MKNNITGLIISAGLSSRMGKFKPLLEYDGKLFLERIIDNLAEVCSKIIIVTGHNFENINNFVSSFYPQNKSITLKFNSDYKTGMFSSLKNGIGGCNDEDWILYHFVDQPNLPDKFYTELISQIDRSFDWIQPVIYDKKGHPILFNYKVIQKIINGDSNSNLRLISQDTSIKKKYWECGYKEIFTDIDTVTDLNNLQKVKQ
jgi:molybdenum cofactor cytidylyltransferase